MNRPLDATMAMLASLDLKVVCEGARFCLIGSRRFVLRDVAGTACADRGRTATALAKRSVARLALTKRDSR